MTRRGFTLLETTLALVIGSLILAATLGVLMTVEDADRTLGRQSRQMNDLAATQDAVRRAMASLVLAPDGTVREAVEASTPGADPEAVLDTQFGGPIPGVAWRFEMTPGERPRLEVVLSAPLIEPVSPGSASRPAGRQGDVQRVTASELLAHRGAFELREPPPARPGATPARGLELWWVPMEPALLPAGVSFDAETLPPPTRLCREVDLLRWTAFIDSQRVPAVRAAVQRQLPAYLELEIRTIGGGYGNWTFEIGFQSGPEFAATADLFAEEPPDTAPREDGGDS